MENPGFRIVSRRNKLLRFGANMRSERSHAISKKTGIARSKIGKHTHKLHYKGEDIKKTEKRPVGDSVIDVNGKVHHAIESLHIEKCARKNTRT